jgi:hypothetical protein
MVDEVERDEGFSLGEVLHALGRLQLQALGYMKHEDVPQEGKR